MPSIWFFYFSIKAVGKADISLLEIIVFFFDTNTLFLEEIMELNLLKILTNTESHTLWMVIMLVYYIWFLYLTLLLLKY